MTSSTATFTVSKRNGGVDEFTDNDEARLRNGIMAHSAVKVRNVSFTLNKIDARGIAPAGVRTHSTIVCTVRFSTHATVDVIKEALELTGISHISFNRIHVDTPAPAGIHRA